MLTIIKTGMLIGNILVLNTAVHAQQSQIAQPKTEKNMEIILIDKATVPANAKEEFIDRMNRSRDFIRQQPGLVSEQAYQNTDQDRNLTVMTTVIWENEEALQQARQAVVAEYKREGFNMIEFCQKWGIKIERGNYQLMVH